MIPKTIHYCWFGNNPKNEEIDMCIKSWEKTCSDFTIKEWNELNFPIDQFPFAKRMYEAEKWAFVADYARLYILEKYGGFYLDTDMLLLQPLSPMTSHTCVLGEEAVGVISAGMLGAEAHNPFIGACKDIYDHNTEELVTIPRVLTAVFETFPNKSSLTVYPPQTFYPFDASTISSFTGQDLGPEVFGVHLWHHSWGHPLNKAFKKIGIYTFGKKVVEVLGIKTTLKKLLGFI
jgi:Glycosyltransferase sugar-binding region containing DXD motif